MNSASIGRPYDPAEQTVRHALALVATRPDREQVAEAAIRSAYRRAREGASIEIVEMGILGIDNNFRLRSGPRKGQHRDGTLVIATADLATPIASL